VACNSVICSFCFVVGWWQCSAQSWLVLLTEHLCAFDGCVPIGTVIVQYSYGSFSCWSLPCCCILQFGLSIRLLPSLSSLSRFVSHVSSYSVSFFLSSFASPPFLYHLFFISAEGIGWVWPFYRRGAAACGAHWIVCLSLLYRLVCEEHGFVPKMHSNSYLSSVYFNSHFILSRAVIQFKLYLIIDNVCIS